MSQRTTADIVVIGGGAVGTAVACFLARAGQEVVLVERGEYAWGSSRRCDGNIATYDSPPGYFSRLCKLSIDLFDVIIPELNYDIQFITCGHGLLVDNEEDLEIAKRNVEGKIKEGVPAVFWDRNELKHREPKVADDMLACIDFECDAKLNPMRLTFALADLARRKGSRLQLRTQVTGIRMENGAVRAVETDKGEILTNKVILAAGVWTPMIGAMAGLHVPVRPRQGQLLVTERQKGFTMKSYSEFGYIAAKEGRARPGVTAEMEEYGIAFVFEPTHGGTCLIGSSRRFDGMNTEPHPLVAQALAQRGVRFFPCLADSHLIRTYAGVRPSTPDGKPIISPTHIEGMYVATGHEGNGIGLSLVTGLLMTQLICGEKPDMDLQPLSIDRFGLNPPALF